MVDINELVRLAIEEFGDDAYKRFYVVSPAAFLKCVDSNSVIDAILISWESECRIKTKRFGHANVILPDCPVQLKPLPELFANDVEVYSDNAYQIWECKGRILENNGLTEMLFASYSLEMKRKTSAEREFNLDDAKAGDVVEVSINGAWKVETAWFHTSYIHGDIVIYGERKLTANINNLRMKYPKRRNHES